MFNRPGRKLQTLAALVFAIIFVVYIIIGLVFIRGTGAGAGMVVLFCLLGLFIAWLSSICLYAFGSLVDDVEEIKILLKWVHGVDRDE